MQISDLLQIGRGVTALIGGGGKTTLLYRLAEELRKKGTVILATSTRIYPPQQYALVMDGEEAVLCRALKEYGVVAVGTINEEGKLRAPVFSFEELATFADYVLVEADGAKCRPLKAHASHEPVIPDNAQRVVLVVGADGFGKPIEEVCHRPELYAPRCGAAAEDAVTAELAAKVILAEGYGDRVYINKVETAQDYDRAVHLAQLLRCPVVAGSLHQGVFACLR